MGAFLSSLNNEGEIVFRPKGVNGVDHSLEKVKGSSQEVRGSIATYVDLLR